jgi:hypothetical protein
MHCPCGFASDLDPRTAEYHRRHRERHLEVFPQSDAETRASLDRLVSVFENREARFS